MTHRDDNEARRLATLHALRLLDTDANPAIDGLVEAAAALCNVPIALVTLLDERRQWFKSRHGLDAVSETQREIALCHHAIRSPAVMIVEDAHIDPRFADNPLVTGDLGLRFYAGAPLIAANGHRLGALCVIDRRPGSLEFGQTIALQRLADAVVRLLYTEAATSYPKSRDHNDGARRTDKAEQILSAAMRVLREEGAAAFSARKVAKSTGISLGHLQHYYPNNSALLHATVDACAASLNRYYEDVIAPIPNPVDRFIALARFVLKEDSRGHLFTLMRQLWAIADNDTQLSRSLAAIYARTRRLLAQFLRQANRDLSISESLQRAAVAISLLSGAFFTLKPRTARASNEDFADYVLAHLVRLPY